MSDFGAADAMAEGARQAFRNTPDQAHVHEWREIALASGGSRWACVCGASANAPLSTSPVADLIYTPDVPPKFDPDLIYTRAEVDAATFGPQRDELVLRNLQHTYSMGRRGSTGRTHEAVHRDGLKAVFDLGHLWGWEDAHDSEGASS